MQQPLFSQDILSVFPSTYGWADTAFKQAVEQLPQPHRLQTLAYEGAGPEGEVLTTRVAWIGNADARRVLLLQSAVHGVEGFSGSAIQLDLLRRLRNGDVDLPADLALVVVHAVNPWGYAWCRRVDEQGIDINRNFADFEAELPVNHGYRDLAAALVPESDDWTAADAQLQRYREQHGQYQYELAVSGGQYEYPEGLFYGGQAPSQARRNLEQVIAEVDCAQRRVAVIDLHTGLGPYGHGEVICDHLLNSAGLRTAQRWFGNAVTIPEGGQSCSVPKVGLVDYAWHAVMNDYSCYITLEFGTFPISELLRCLRQDHAARRPGQVKPFNTLQSLARDQLQHQFYPGEPQWQTLVLFRARQVIQLAAAGLLNDPL